MCIDGALSSYWAVRERAGLNVSDEIFELRTTHEHLNLTSYYSVRVVSFGVVTFVRFYGAYLEGGVQFGGDDPVEIA